MPTAQTGVVSSRGEAARSGRAEADAVHWAGEKTRMCDRLDRCSTPSAVSRNKKKKKKKKWRVIRIGLF